MPIRVFVLASVQDDRSVCDLAGDQVAVELFTESATLLARLRRETPDLVVLQHRLGERAVIETVERLRAISQVPCILRLMRGDDPTLRVLGLEAGADDCLPAAITPREILARMRAILRRATPRAAPAMNGWQLSLARRDLYTPAGIPCQLTTAEFELLRILMQSGRPVSREDLVQRVFRRPYSPGDRAVDSLVARLRRKLERDGDDPVVKAVRGVGYTFAGLPDCRPMPGQAEDCENCRKLPRNPQLHIAA